MKTILIGKEEFKFGCGVEENPFKCDTPGFKNRAVNSIVFDLRGCQCLELKRTNDQQES
jgi:hypothetical protein